VSDRTFRIGQFARRAHVSERTLRYYDQVGLLAPSLTSPAGYRLYTEADYPRLQQILGLKYLGFSLEEIRACLQHGPQGFRQALAVQKAMMQERQAHLARIIRAIEETEARLTELPPDWGPILHTIEVMQMTEKKDWINKYFNAEQQAELGKLSEASYSEADRAKISQWGASWTEEDQQRADEQWSALYTEARQLADGGAAPDSPEAQAFAGRWMDMIGAFTHGDPGVAQGLEKFWENVEQLQTEQPLFPKVLTDDQQRFVDQALAIYQARQA
jgi:DNA-binding transcriptional MerR regulator